MKQCIDESLKKQLVSLLKHSNVEKDVIDQFKNLRNCDASEKISKKDQPKKKRKLTAYNKI